MAKFKSRPVEIEAEQWFPGKRVKGVRAVSKQVPIFDEFDSRWQTVHVVRVGAAEMELVPGDWVTYGPDGGTGICRDDYFKRTYEPA